MLRVASWDEYIDMGGDFLDPDPENGDGEYIEWYKELTGIDLLDSKPLYEEFESWYNETYPDKKIQSFEFVPTESKKEFTVEVLEYKL